MLWRNTDLGYNLDDSQHRWFQWKRSNTRYAAYHYLTTTAIAWNYFALHFIIFKSTIRGKNLVRKLRKININYKSKLSLFFFYLIFLFLINWFFLMVLFCWFGLVFIKFVCVEFLLFYIIRQFYYFNINLLLSSWMLL